MAKRKASGSSKATSSTRKTSSSRRPASQLKKKTSAGQGARKAAAAKKKSAKSAGKLGGRPKTATRRAAVKKTATRSTSARKAASRGVGARPKRGRTRPQTRRRESEEMVPTPPSSLNMNRRGSAARTGRDEMAEERADHANMTPSITGGDVDANVEDAYFTGDEAPGGDNPTPDQDIVDDIGRALGVEYQDNEELRASDKVADRDKHRWELDPASSEDYRDRK